MLSSQIASGRRDDNEMVSVQDIQLIPRLAALELTLLPVLVEFGAIVSLPLGICQHNHFNLKWGIGLDPALPKMLVLLAATSKALERSLARLWVYLAWTRPLRN